MAQITCVVCGPRFRLKFRTNFREAPGRTLEFLSCGTAGCAPGTTPILFYNPCETMAITIGTQLGSHVITALIGKGGMGEVYRARDLKLKREVAIKVLPGEFAHDSDRVSRFQREAEVLASLNHPN